MAMMALLSPLLRKIMRRDQLVIIDAAGTSHSFGPGGRTTTLRFHDRWVPLAIARNPGLAMGELYMDGRVTVEDGDILDFMDVVLGNMEWSPDSPLHQLGAGPQSIANWLGQFNWFARSRQNVAHHYDLGDTLYELFLDKDWQYSCGYFADDGKSIDDAQADKKAHIASKLLLEKDHSVLDIGSGWGGMALYLNKISGAKVTGVTLSDEQIKRAKMRAADKGVEDKVQFHLQDYRDVDGPFDRIVSVGMFEHVGRPQYRTFFEKCRSLLAEDGVMLLHTIARADGPGGTNPWMRKYIFPGGYSPSLSEIAPAVERAGLWITDMEVWRLHYARTLEAWYERTVASKDKIVALYDERFWRMWLFYLAASICTFRHLGHVVFQIQLTRRQDAVPLTRDYMIETERALHAKV